MCRAAAASCLTSLATAALLAGCSPDANMPRTALRLVSPELRGGASSAPPEMQLRRPGLHAWEAADPLRPTATLANETRPVLASVWGGPRRFERGVQPDASGRLEVAIPDGAFTRAEAFVAVVRVRDAATPTAASRALPARRLAAGSPSLVVELPPELRARELDVYVETWRPPSGDRTRYETAPIASSVLPEWAATGPFELEFGFGVLEAAVDAGPVEFEIARCVQDDCDVVFRERYDGAAGWRDRRIPIELGGDRPVRLRFDAVWKGVVADSAAGAGSGDEAGWSLPVWSDPRVLAPAPAGFARPPSIILLSLDTLRADHLPLYGYARDTAPFMSGALAEQGTVFDALVAAATTTGPSHMTMFTSLAPSVHQVAGSHRAMAIPVPTLAALLRDAGYETAAVTDDGAIDHERGFALGFDRFHENKNARAMETGQIEATFARALEWLDSRAGRPSFTFLHSFQVHDPYTPPARYAQLFAADALAPAAGQPDRVRWARALMTDYDREIRYVDDELAAFVSELERRGFFASGVLVVTSDHGEAFLEHGVQGHGGRPHQELLHAPLIVRGRGVAAGRRIAEPVAHADVMPTLLELASVDAPAHARGRSLAARLGEGVESAGAPAPGPIIVSEAWGLHLGGEMPALSARQGGYKLMRTKTPAGVVDELFDLDRDGRERTNLAKTGARPLAPVAAAALRRLSAALDAYAAETAVQRAALAGAHGEGRDQDLPLDPDREAKLRALGYIE